MSISDTLHNFQEGIFDIIVYITYFLIILAALGISQYAPTYLNDLDYYVKIYVSLFLIIRFNPFIRLKFTELDRKITFTSGLFLITTTAISQHLTKKLTKISNNTKTFIMNKIDQDLDI
jgi:hypothetical protein